MRAENTSESSCLARQAARFGEIFSREGVKYAKKTLKGKEALLGTDTQSKQGTFCGKFFRTALLTGAGWIPGQPAAVESECAWSVSVFSIRCSGPAGPPLFRRSRSCSGRWWKAEPAADPNSGRCPPR